MPKQDTLHESVKNALLKDGWTITADPFIPSGGEELINDETVMERPLAAMRGKRQIIVTAKSFLGASTMMNLYGALGHTLILRSLIEENNTDEWVYIAIRDTTYARLKESAMLPFIQSHSKMPLIVVDADKEEIIEWIN